MYELSREISCTIIAQQERTGEGSTSHPALQLNSVITYCTAHCTSNLRLYSRNISMESKG